MSFMDKVERVGYRIGKQKHILAMRDSVFLAMPLILIGSVFVIIQAFPIPAWETFLTETGAMDYLGGVTNATFGIIGLITVFGIAKRLADSYDVDGNGAGVIAIASYLMLIPAVDNQIAFGYLGSRGLFVALLVGMLTGELFRFFVQRNWVIRMPDSVPPAVSRSFSSLIPGFLIILTFIAIDLSVKALGFSDIYQVAIVVLAEPLKLASNSLWGTLLAVLLNSLVWLCGIHGGQLISSVMDPIWLMNTDANRVAWQAGQELPFIVTKPFLDNFAWVGGGGATFGLAIFLFFFVKSRQNKALGKVALVPNFFSVNEPMLFGFPIVLSLHLAIPFIVTPLVTGTVSYLAMYFGLVHKTVGIVIPWATPPIISGYLSTGGHISGSLLQIVNIIISFLIYYPFVKRIDQKMKREEEQHEATAQLSGE